MHRSKNGPLMSGSGHSLFWLCLYVRFAPCRAANVAGAAARAAYRAAGDGDLNGRGRSAAGHSEWIRPRRFALRAPQPRLCCRDFAIVAVICEDEGLISARRRRY